MTQALITGFEPFGPHRENTSAQVATALSGREGWHTDVLPVDFARAPLRIGELVRSLRPRVVLSVGLAGGAQDLALERVAINLVDARIPDNAGQQPVDQPVVPGGPAAYLTTLPVKAMRRAIEGVGVPVRLSLSAGTYGCNAVMYAALHAAAGLDRNDPERSTRVGFLHLPAASEVPVDAAIAATVAAVECALNTGTDDAVADGALS